MRVLGGHSDEVLFNLVKEDREGAFKTLYNRYWEKLLEVAYLKLRSQQEAEEAVQEVFISIWTNRHKIDLKYTFRTYISAALKYTIYRHVASKTKYQNVELGNDLENSLQDHSTENWLAFTDALLHLETVVAQLPNKCRIIYRMSREDGLSTRQISSVLAISEKTVEGHITKALKHIRENLNDLSIFFIFF